eukprot:2254800-Prymnesium_polylepis.1
MDKAGAVQPLQAAQRFTPHPQHRRRGEFGPWRGVTQILERGAELLHHEHFEGMQAAGRPVVVHE